MAPPLLPSSALRSRRVGISLSQSPDLARLGLLEAHVKLALGEIARAVLVSGGGLVWGGGLSSDGYTTFVATESQRYARPDRPLIPTTGPSTSLQGFLPPPPQMLRSAQPRPDALAPITIGMGSIMASGGDGCGSVASMPGGGSTLTVDAGMSALA